MAIVVSNATAQNLSATIDRKDILIGEPIQYNLTFSIPGTGFKAAFLVPDSIPHFEIMGKRSRDSVRGGSFVVQQELKLTSWDSGRWYIPKIPVRVYPAGGNAPYTAYTDEVEVNVAYAPEDSTGQLRDIKSVIHVPYVDRDWLLLVLGLVTAVAIIVFLIYYFRKNKRGEKPLYHSSLSAYDEATKNLEQLKALNLKQPDEVKKFHSSVSDIFKRYFSRKRQQNFMHKTTGEILLDMRAEGATSEAISALAESLRYNDVVKFAKFIPEEQDSYKSLESMKKAIGFIEADSKQDKKV